MDKFPNVNLSASKEKPDLSKSRKVAATDFSESAFYANLKTTVQIKKPIEEAKPTFDTSELDERELIVYSSMEFNKPASIDDFSKIDMETSELASIITMLEIKGAIESAPGGFYIKK